MSDDLVKRLRDSTEWYHHDAELKMKCAARIEELEAKLARAVEALERIQDGSYGKNAAIARANLAELSSVSCANTKKGNTE